MIAARALAAVTALAAGAVGAPCSSSSSGSQARDLTTSTDSETLPDRSARLDLFARYVPARGPIVDAEYDIEYHDHSGGMMPGPSDWNIRAVIELTGDPAAWAAGWTPCSAPADGSEPPVPAWARALLARRPAWQHPRSAPRCVRDPRHAGTTARLYADDHLIVYHSVSELSAAD